MKIMSSKVKSSLSSMKFKLMLIVGELSYKYCFSLYIYLYLSLKFFSCKRERQFLKKYIEPGMTVIDIGSNIGYFSLLFSNLVGVKGKVYCFEPSSENLRVHQKLTKKRNNIIINHKAVANKSGKLTLYISDKSNLDHRTYPSGENRITCEVEAVSLDDYNFPKSRVDFIKIDSQGYEYEIFLGMRNVIKNNTSLKILSEFWPYGLRKAGRKPEELIKLLKSYGLKIYIIEQQDKLVNFSFDRINTDINSEEFYDIFCCNTLHVI